MNRLFRHLALLLPFSLIFLLCGCEWMAEQFDYTGRTVDFCFYNKSKDTIQILSVLWGLPDEEDSIIEAKHFYVFEFQGHCYQLAPGDSVTLTAYPEVMAELKRKHQIMLLSQTTLNNYSQEDIVKNNIYDKLFILNFRDLKSADFKLYYTDDK